MKKLIRKLDWIVLKPILWFCRTFKIIGAGKEWSKPEEYLIVHYADETIDQQLSKMIGRSVASIRMKRSRLLHDQEIQALEDANKYENN